MSGMRQEHGLIEATNYFLRLGHGQSRAWLVAARGVGKAGSGGWALDAAVGPERDEGGVTAGYAYDGEKTGGGAELETIRRHSDCSTRHCVSGILKRHDTRPLRHGWEVTDRSEAKREPLRRGGRRMYETSVERTASRTIAFASRRGEEVGQTGDIRWRYKRTRKAMEGGVLAAAWEPRVRWKSDASWWVISRVSYRNVER
ncbi:hypothetical protein K438DRAFT_1973743 [Mycena galopus ATCC 62051]|nr:hypothetical protein K438DRAFT_1973743 [Mycena galopus ATCC 62051]